MTTVLGRDYSLMLVLVLVSVIARCHTRGRGCGEVTGVGGGGQGTSRPLQHALLPNQRQEQHQRVRVLHGNGGYAVLLSFRPQQGEAGMHARTPCLHYAPLRHMVTQTRGSVW